jgi:pimeloyl-ACP methyl ester carboxylesterase
MFKFIDRGQKDSLVLISGWAFDCRIFDRLDLPFNYFCYCGSVESFGKAMEELLEKEKLAKVSMLGWSRGAFVAANYVCKRPGRIDMLILAGARKRYEKQAIETIKEYVRKNRMAFLYKFYRDCFSRSERENYLWFKQTLQKEYLEQADQELIGGLDGLSAMCFDFDSLRAIKNVKIVHGLDDSVAPVSDAAELAKELPLAELIILENSGHLPFLHRDFKAGLS